MMKRWKNLRRELQIWWLALAIKSLYAFFLPFAHDEAYYWVWGHHPQLSYFDHPPMIGWLMTLGIPFEHFGHAGRLPVVLVGHLTALVWLKILQRWMSSEQLCLWLTLYLLAPLTGLGSLVATPDVPLMFFWSVALWQSLRLREFPTVGNAALLGLSMGLGFCSKYTMVLFVPPLLLTYFFIGAKRVFGPRLILTAVAFGLIGCIPVLLWNAQNDWASFHFQTEHGLSGKAWRWYWPLDYLGGQLGLLFPTTVLLAALTIRRLPRHFLVWFAVFPLAFFLYSSFKARVEANWPMVAYPSVLALATLANRWHKVLRWTAVLWFSVLVALTTHLLYPWLPLNPRKLKTFEWVQFDSLLEIAKQNPNLFAGSYQMAASLSYKLRRPIYKLAGVNRRDFYDFLPEARVLSEHFFLILEPDHDLPEWVKQAGYSEQGRQTLTDGLQLLEVIRRAP